jgi:hypothetical protein
MPEKVQLSRAAYPALLPVYPLGCRFASDQNDQIVRITDKAVTSHFQNLVELVQDDVRQQG